MVPALDTTKELTDSMLDVHLKAPINEPRREKTGLRDFRPGPTQTGLYKLRKKLEA